MTALEYADKLIDKYKEIADSDFIGPWSQGFNDAHEFCVHDIKMLKHYIRMEKEDA